MSIGNVKVKYSTGRTLNMGNFESVRIDVGLEMVVKDDSTVVEETYESIKKFVDGRVEAEVRDHKT